MSFSRIGLFTFTLLLVLFAAACGPGDDSCIPDGDYDDADADGDGDEEGVPDGDLPDVCEGSCTAETPIYFCETESRLCSCSNGTWIPYDCAEICELDDKQSMGCGESDGRDYPFCICEPKAGEKPCAAYGSTMPLANEADADESAAVCANQWWSEPGADACYDGENADGTVASCCPARARVGDASAIICESRCGECGGGATEESLQWPGPGFGCFRFSLTSEPVAGWRNLDIPPERMEGDGGCLNSWTDAKLAQILDRDEADPTPCAEITDVTQCITTDNAPSHCRPLLGWPLDMLDDACQFDAYTQLTSQAALDKAVFLGCRAVTEYSLPVGAPAYQGMLKSDTDGSCVFFSGGAGEFPAGWSQSDCASCSE